MNCVKSHGHPSRVRPPSSSVPYGAVRSCTSLYWTCATRLRRGSRGLSGPDVGWSGGQAEAAAGIPRRGHVQHARAAWGHEWVRTECTADGGHTRDCTASKSWRTAGGGKGRASATASTPWMPGPNDPARWNAWRCGARRRCRPSSAAARSRSGHPRPATYRARSRLPWSLCEVVASERSGTRAGAASTYGHGEASAEKIRANA